jgi:hypothetical protein
MKYLEILTGLSMPGNLVLMSFTGMNSDLTISFAIEEPGCNASGSIILSDPVLTGGDVLISEVS